MAKRKQVTNEQLCTALITYGSIKDVAQHLDISTRTIYNMMQENDFKELYDHAQADILNNVVIVCRNNLIDAVNCIADIMNDKDVNAQTRLLAAQTMLNKCTPLYNTMQDMRNKAYDEQYNIL